MLPVFPVVLPLFTAGLLAALAKIISQRLSQILALCATLATLIIDVWLLRASANQIIVYWFGDWRPRHGIALGISFTVDPIGAGFAAFSAVLVLAALVFSSEYFDTADNHFHALLLAFLAALSGFTLTGDMFNLFVFFELMSAAAFALCGHKTDDPGSLQGALNFAVVNTIAAYFVLMGIGLLYARTGALNMAQMGRALSSGPLDSPVLIGFVFLVCGYLVKAAVVPFHFWLADAHAVAPSPVCILFSGVMVEMGLFALGRIYWATFQPVLHSHGAGLATLFVTVGVVTACVGAFMCYIQRHLKRLLAFSTISHVGLMLIGIGVFNAEGLAGTAIYTLGHGLVKGALFLLAGILLHRFETVDEHELYGKGRREPLAAILFFAGGFALAGLPGSGVAAGSDLLEGGADLAAAHWIRWILFGAGTVTSAAVLRAGIRIFVGKGWVEDTDSAPKHEEKPETKGQHQRTPAAMLISTAVLAVAGLLLGLTPKIETAVIRSAARFENAPAYAAQVLDSAHSLPPLPTPREPKPSGIPTGWIAVPAALGIALTHLFSSRARDWAGTAAKPLGLLHRLHSGHVGDYVAFMTCGMACFGLLCVYCFR